MYRLVTGVCVLLVAALVYLYYDDHRQMREYRQDSAALQLQIDALRQQVKAHQAQVETLQDKVQALEESSVQNVVRDANSAILDGLQSLMTTVEGELDRAREAFRRAQQSAPGSTDGPAEPAAGADTDAAPSESVPPAAGE